MDNFVNETLGLYCLSNCISHLLEEHEYDNDSKESMIDLYVDVKSALDLLSKYDQATEDENEDLKHEFGFLYSETLATIEDKMNNINNKGINLYLH